MKYAIIAGGEGSRLAQEGVTAAKPLVKLNGESLIDRLTRIFADNGAESIAIIYRKGMDDVERHLEALQHDGAGAKHMPVNTVGACTQSSMHSMFAISSLLEGAPFCLTTVDTVFNEDAFRQYVKALTEATESGEADGVMAVTDYIDDEKPLYVATDSDMNITAFLDKNDGCRYVSAGIYGLVPRALEVLRNCIERGESRMRNFQRALLHEGFRLKAINIGKAFDIDHASDIAKAEHFLRGQQ